MLSRSRLVTNVLRNVRGMAHTKRPKPLPKVNVPEINKKKTQEQKDRRDGKPEVKEIGGPKGEEPTRYGDWERDGRCCDFIDFRIVFK